MNQVIAKSRRKYGGSEFKGILHKIRQIKPRCFHLSFAGCVTASERNENSHHRSHLGPYLDTWVSPHHGTTLEYRGLGDVSPWEGRGGKFNISNINSLNLKWYRAFSPLSRYFAWLVSGKCSQSFLLFGNQRQYPALVISGAYPWFWGDQIWSDLLPLPPWPE